MAFGHTLQFGTAYSCWRHHYFWQSFLNRDLHTFSLLFGLHSYNILTLWPLNAKENRCQHYLLCHCIVTLLILYLKIVNTADHLFPLELIINPNKALLSPLISLCVSRSIFRVSHYCNQKENPSPVSSIHLVECVSLFSFEECSI